MARTIIALCALVFAVVSAAQLNDGMPDEIPMFNVLPSTGRVNKFSWRDCGNSSFTGNITEVLVAPDPLDFPGDLILEIKADLKSRMDKGLQGDVLMEKKLGSKWVKLPCIDFVGSCHYDDVCALLQHVQNCPQQMVKAGIPCHCPYEAKQYYLPRSTFSVGIPVMPSGDMHIVGNLQYHDRPVACLELYLSFA